MGDTKNFAKLHRKMYDSSVAENWKALVTFQQLCILCDMQGVVDMTPNAIHRVTNIPIDIIEEGLEALEQPDEESRSTFEDGRRIVRLDDHRSWGWIIVNHEKYTFDDEEKREYMRKYMRDYRERQKAEQAGNKKKAKKRPKKAEKPDPKPAPPPEQSDFAAERTFKFPGQTLIPDDFEITPKVRRWCEKNKHRPRPEEYIEEFVAHFTAKGTRWKDWDQTFINWIRDELPGGKYHNPKRYAARIENRPRPAHQPANGGGKAPPDPQAERLDAIAHAERMVKYCEDRPELQKYWQEQLDRLQSKSHTTESKNDTATSQPQ